LQLRLRRRRRGGRVGVAACARSQELGAREGLFGLPRFDAAASNARGAARACAGRRAWALNNIAVRRLSYSYLKYKGLAHLNLATCAAHNFDHPNALDLALLVEHLLVLKRGKAVEVPPYNFAMRARMPGAATKSC